MSFPAAARAVTSTAVRFFGGDRTVTLRRRHSLQLQSTGEPVSALRTDGAQLAGVVALNLKGSGGVAGATVRGTLIAGATFTLTGDATVYTVGADVSASTAGKLAAVAIAPALVVGVSDGVLVTLVHAYADRTVYALRGEEDRRDDDRGRELGGIAYHLVGDDLAAPEAGDLILDGTETWTVASVRPVSPGGSPARWTVMVGAL